MYILYYKTNKTLEKTKKEDVLDDIYYQRASLPTKKQVEDYLKKIIKILILKSFFKVKILMM